MRDGFENDLVGGCTRLTVYRASSSAIDAVGHRFDASVAAHRSRMNSALAHTVTYESLAPCDADRLEPAQQHIFNEAVEVADPLIQIRISFEVELVDGLLDLCNRSAKASVRYSHLPSSSMVECISR